MKKYLVFLLLPLVLVPYAQSNKELSVDLRLVWNDMSTFSGSEHTYGVELVDWDRCDEVYWDGYRCVFTAGIRILQIERGTITWKKEYLHLKYGETEINQKFKDIIIKKVKINNIAFTDGYVDITIFYENRYVSDERPMYEKIVGEEETVIHIGDVQNVYSFYVSAFDDRIFYVFYLNGEKKSEEGSNVLPDERVNLWLNISIGYVNVNNNKIFSIYAPSRFRILKTENFGIREKEVMTINGEDLSVTEDVLKIGKNEYPLEENEFIVTSVGWIIYREGVITMYAEKIEITEHPPDLNLVYDPCSVFLNEKKTITVRIENNGKGLGEVNFRAYGMGVDYYSWDGTLAYEEFKEMDLEISPKTMYDTLFIEINSEKIEIPVTIETRETQTPVPETQAPVSTTSPAAPLSSEPEKKPITVFFIIISLTFLAIFGQNRPQKEIAQKKTGKKSEPRDADRKNRTKDSDEKNADGCGQRLHHAGSGLPKKSFKYLNKKI